MLNQSISSKTIKSLITSEITLVKCSRANPHTTHTLISLQLCILRIYHRISCQNFNTSANSSLSYFFNYSSSLHINSPQMCFFCPFFFNLDLSFSQLLCLHYVTTLYHPIISPIITSFNQSISLSGIFSILSSQFILYCAVNVKKKVDLNTNHHKWHIHISDS